jgi:hypothetical protein
VKRWMKRLSAMGKWFSTKRWMAKSIICFSKMESRSWPTSMKEKLTSSDMLTSQVRN